MSTELLETCRGCK